MILSSSVATNSESVKVILDETYVEVPEPGEDEWEAFQAVDIDSASLNGIHETTNSILECVMLGNFLLALLIGVQLASIFSRFMRN